MYFITYQDGQQTESVLRKLFYEGDDDTLHSLAIYPKHLIYANLMASSFSEAEALASPPSTSVMSENVNVGDVLWIKDAAGGLFPKRFVKVDETLAYVRHPLTFSHNIIVDGVLASVHVGHEYLLRLVYSISPPLNDSWFAKKIVQSWDNLENHLVG